MSFKCHQILFFVFVTCANGIEMPGTCKPGQYYDPGALECTSCFANSSLVTSTDGFACSCEDHSVPLSVSRCRPCNATEVVSSDGRSCVPRRCQGNASKLVCRKCPNDYISVTQNPDGSPTKEVQCVKCARGFRAYNNVCVRCEACACARQEIVVRGRCVPKRFVTDRPKHEETKLNELLDIVKYEYFCILNDLLACRALADVCVRSYYSADLAGPCRLWVQPKLAQPKGLPSLTMDPSDKDPSEIGLVKGMDTLHLVQARFTSGGVKFEYQPNERILCFLPLKISIGTDYSFDCKLNVSDLQPSLAETMSPLVLIDGDLRPLPVALKKPNGYLIERSTWPNNKFKRYFLLHNSLSITSNITDTVYLKTLLIKLRIERNKFKSPILRLLVTLEAQYATKSPLSKSVTMSLRVIHEMPSSGVMKGLEIWGGILGGFLSLYAVVQWRGNVRRGGLHFSLVPILAAAIADALYFYLVGIFLFVILQAAWFSTLHALAAEAGTLGMTLPLSRSEERIVKAFVYSAVALKTLKVVWINWSQCRCDMFFLDWSEYNAPVKDMPYDKSESWRATTLAREWSRMQTTRRASPPFTVTLALIILNLLQSWQFHLPASIVYKWAVASLAWSSAYVVVIVLRYLLEKVAGASAHTALLPKVCTSVGLSLLVFQEEYYAHYIHGRNDESDARSLVGPLSACRIVCALQLRTVYKQLSTPGLVALGEKDSRKALLSKFLAAFFERALDGLSWVASERTVPERLLDVELVAREAGNTSVLLYNPDDSTPSCFNVTWWGEEWTLGTFDGMLFGTIFIVTDNSLLSALITLIVWQVNKLLRQWCGNKNQIEKTDVNITFKN